MATRNLNFEGAVGACKTISVQDARLLKQGIDGKVAELGITVNARQRSRTAAPQEKGNLNVRSILQWVECLTKPADDASDEAKAEYDADCEKLSALSATLGMRL